MIMKPSRRGKAHFSSFSSTTVTYTFQNEHSTSDLQTKVIHIPIHSPSDEPSSSPIPVTAHLPTPPPPLSQEPEASAAVKIQSAYRSYVVRSLVKIIRAVNSEANYWERLIQRQETVDAVRSDEREKIKINEALMDLLFRLDSVPGHNNSIRELRRHVSRRIVGLQEILDAVADTRVENWDGFLRDWDDILAGIEKEACKERGGGHEMERFCAENLGFRCLQRFLQDQ